jgi:tRNA(adenine34) deaminase
MKKLDFQYFMYKALDQAKLAFERDEVPIGAVIVNSEGEILSKAFNLVEKRQSPIAHAEILAIEKACKKLKNWRLEGCTIFVTLEPCSMCLAALQLSRILKLVYGATSLKYGYKVNEVLSFNKSKSKLKIVDDILANESIRLLRLFFNKKRKSSSE